MAAVNGTIIANGVRRLSRLSIISQSSRSENLTKVKNNQKPDDSNHSSARRLSAIPRQRANSDPADGKSPPPVTVVHFQPTVEEVEEEGLQAKAQEEADRAARKQARANKQSKVCSLVFFILIVIIVVLYFHAEAVSNRGLNVKQYLLDNVNKDGIRSRLRELTRRPHPTSSEANTNVTQLIADTMRAQGLDLVRVETYDVLLSRPDGLFINTVRILDAVSGLEVNRSSPWQPAESKWPQESWEDLLPAFSAFAGNGTVRGQVVYVNYGREEDYAALTALNITAEGRLVLARHGESASVDKYREAEVRGAIGLIMYGDPADVAHSGSPYPAGAEAPGGAVRLDSLIVGGDPLTPALPALDWAARLPLEEVALPTMPVLPIAYDDAVEIISRLDGPESPAGFEGGFGVEYRVGPGLRDNLTLELAVGGILTRAPVRDVVGVIWGQERDRMLVVGSPHDSWGYGASDSASTTAVLLELTRLFGGLVMEEGWTPARTLVFVSWGGSKDGLLGSTELVQHYAASFAARAVAYLNLDSVMTGNQSFSSFTVPLLYDILEEAAQDVPSPFAEDVWINGTEYTLVDSWRARSVVSVRDGRPKHGGLGATSDYWAFMYQLGVPSADFMFLDEFGDRAVYPLQHTAYDTFELVSEILDPDLAFHQASAKLWSQLVYQFVDLPVVPLSVLAQANHLLLDMSDLISEHEETLLELDVTLRPLHDQLLALRIESGLFEDRLHTLDVLDAVAVRMANDALLLSCRALLDPQEALMQQGAVRSQLYAPSTRNSYNMEVFPGLTDLLGQREAGNDTLLARQLQEVIQTTAYRVLQARLALSDTLFD